MHRRDPRAASPDSWRSLRSARVPPVHYLDKLLRLNLGVTPLNLGVQFLMAERVRFRTSVDKGNMRAVASRVFAEQLSDSTSTMGRTNERRSSVGEHVASWFHRALERPPREEIENRGHARFALLAVSTSVALPMLVE